MKTKVYMDLEAANIQNILDFEKDYPDAEVVKLGKLPFNISDTRCS